MQTPPKEFHFPEELIVDTYRNQYPDLAPYSDEFLHQHYFQYGRSEGRAGNGILNRNDFINLVPKFASILEIGPFDAPLVRGNKVAYSDVMNCADLKERARLLGRSPENVPNIDYVLADAGLDEINDLFDVVISCHSIEHQPNLIEHLQQVSRRLSRKGYYFLIIPDKRYCFDHFIAPSTIAEVVQAGNERRHRHTLRSVIEHSALTTHNDALRHWQDRNDSAPDFVIDAENVERSMRLFSNSNGSYIDVHAWYFTPQSFAQIISLLNKLGMIDIGLARIYPTRFGQLEFFVILEKI